MLNANHKISLDDSVKENKGQTSVTSVRMLGSVIHNKTK